MDVLITLFYMLFVCCVVYPPIEFVSAGITIDQMFENYLGSENTNFVLYHMKRTMVTVLVHSVLPVGYVFTLWCGGVSSDWLPVLAIGAAMVPVIAGMMMVGWWEKDKDGHPVVKALQPYATEGWRVVAADLNMEFRNVDKVLLPLTATSKLVATRTWLVKVTQYRMHVVKQTDCTLVATATDSHHLSQSGEDEIQYINVEVIPRREDIKQFSFRVSVTALRELQPRLAQPVRVPDHISLLPSLVERFVNVFKMHVAENPVYYIDQEPELCIGCMTSPADVKLARRCMQPPPGLIATGQECQQCNCRVLWCGGCMARWWAARAPEPAEQWLSGRGRCPVCRAYFCLLDVCPAQVRPTSA